MQSLWLENQQLSFHENQSDPHPDADEAFIQITCAGICNTDLEILRGYYPFAGIPGHEFTGVVLDSPAHPGWTGKRVTGEINLPCGVCPECLAGRGKHCRSRRVLGILRRDGIFAQLTTLPVVNLHEIPAGLADEQAVFCEPLAAALQIQQQVHIQPGMAVAVIGAGKLGQLIARSLALTGCDLTVIARHDRQIAQLEGQNIRAQRPGQTADAVMDVVVDASGSPQGFQDARRLVHPGGILVMKSTYAGRMEINLSSMVVDEIQLVGSRCGPYEPALRLMSSGQIRVDDLVDGVYPLRDWQTAFKQAQQPGAEKILFTLDK
jgi:threonine dehydrogenase-like Zn-dependent dehydrogenase